MVSGDNFSFINILGEATDAISAHLRLTAIGIDDSHSYIGVLRRENHQDSISPNPQMTFTE
jgi:hypothetical protein